MMAGQTYWLSWKGLGFLRDLTGYSFEFSGPGAANASRWTWTPSSGEVGSYRLTVRVRQGGLLIGRASTTIVVKPSTGANGTCRAVVGIGDSITAAAGPDAFPNLVQTAMVGAGVSFSMFGSTSSAGALPGVVHDGFPGRTFLWHDTDAAAPWSAGGVNHVTTYGSGVPYTDVWIGLGTNDWAAQRGPTPGPYHPEDFAQVITNAESLVQKIRAGSPNARIWVSPTYNPADGTTFGPYSAEEFESDRRIGVGLLFDTFANREGEGILIPSPTHACLDPSTDLPADDVHPNALGHAKISACVAGALIQAYA